MVRELMARMVWWMLIRVAHMWTSDFMDQWEQVQFETKNGTIYLTLTRQTEWPEAFERVDANGNPISPRPKNG